jgi:hypothetical protein
VRLREPKAAHLRFATPRAEGKIVIGKEEPVRLFRGGGPSSEVLDRREFQMENTGAEKLLIVAGAGLAIILALMAIFVG